MEIQIDFSQFVTCDRITFQGLLLDRFLFFLRKEENTGQVVKFSHS
jgi:hypothetical protein